MAECTQLTLLGNISIISGTAQSGLCHGLPGKVRENRRVIDEPRITHRLCQHAPPSLRLPHHASSNKHHGDKCWGPRRLPVSGQEYYHSRRPLLLGLYKPGLVVGGAYVQVRQAPLPPRQRQASARSRSRPELDPDRLASKRVKNELLHYALVFLRKSISSTVRVDNDSDIVCMSN